MTPYEPRHITGIEGQLARLAAFTGQVRARMLTAMAVVGEDVADHVRMTKLSGQVLKIRTGKLLRSINARVTEDSPTEISARIGSNLETGRYNAIHEEGGSVSFRAHTRMCTMAFGRQLKSPHPVNVRTYTAFYPQRAYLRPSVDEKMPDEQAFIRAQLDIAIAENNTGAV